MPDRPHERRRGSRQGNGDGRAAVVPPAEDRSLNWVVPLLVIYLWFLITTPYARFPVLTDIRFERVIVALAWLAALVGGFVRFRAVKTTWLVAAFFTWMCISYVLTPYPAIELVLAWREDYWKVILFYLLILFCTTRLRDVSAMLVAFAVVSGLYQLHSWLDFIRGGSYVYRQGIKRIIGTWSASPGGAGNAFGLLGLLTLPFVQYGLQIAVKRWHRVALYMVAVLSVMSILFSGTRAALVGLVFLVVVQMKNRRVIVAGAVLLALLLAVILFLPPELQARYAALLGSDSEEELDRNAEIAQTSGQSRITGLVDGYTLAKKRPLLGYGPGSSMYARGTVNPYPVGPTGPKYLQLHNLYGQIMAELGFVGLGIFVALAIAYYGGLRLASKRAGPPGKESDQIRSIARTLGVMFSVMLFYGMFGHTLYRFHWMFLLGLQGALVHLALTRGGPQETMIAAARRRRAETAR